VAGGAIPERESDSIAAPPIDISRIHRWIQRAKLLTCTAAAPAPSLAPGPAEHCSDTAKGSDAMIAVIFEVWPRPGRRQDYLALAAALRRDLEAIDGFVSVERFESLSEPGKLLSLSFWRDEAALGAWRNLAVHRSAQSQGRREIFADYRLRVAGVIRDYGMTDREAAPDDSRRAHEGVS
jgi:heme-degrading monooxygenase HmoA